MLKIEHVVLPSPEQMEFVIEGMRNPMNSWEKSDSVRCDEGDCTGCVIDGKCFDCGPNDYDLMARLAAAGSEHRKYLRMMPVMLRITAPLYWWKEFDTYKVGTVANSCSTMHKIMAKEFTAEDFSFENVVDELQGEPIDVLVKSYNTLRFANMEESDPEKKRAYWYSLIQLLPSSYNQTRNVSLNYEVLANIYHQRRNHKLDEWHVVCDWIESLPYSDLVTGEDREKND